MNLDLGYAWQSPRLEWRLLAFVILEKVMGTECSRYMLFNGKDVCIYMDLIHHTVSENG